MPKATQNIVHEYFKKQFEGFTIIVQLNPVHFTVSELTIPKEGKIKNRKFEVDKEIYDDLKEDGFKSTSAIEFNLYVKGLV